MPGAFNHQLLKLRMPLIETTLPVIVVCCYTRANVYRLLLSLVAM